MDVAPGSAVENAADRPRWRVMSLILTFLLLLVVLVFGLVYLETHGRSRLQARALEDIEALAKTRPPLNVARRELANMKFVVAEQTQMKDNSVNPTCLVRLPPSRIDFLRMKIHNATGKWSPPPFPVLAELKFSVSDAATTVGRQGRARYSIVPANSDGTFIGGHSKITGRTYVAQ